MKSFDKTIKPERKGSSSTRSDKHLIGWFFYIIAFELGNMNFGDKYSDKIFKKFRADKKSITLDNNLIS